MIMTTFCTASWELQSRRSVEEERLIRGWFIDRAGHWKLLLWNLGLYFWFWIVVSVNVVLCVYVLSSQTRKRNNETFVYNLFAWALTHLVFFYTWYSSLLIFFFSVWKNVWQVRMLRRHLKNGMWHAKPCHNLSGMLNWHKLELKI